MFTAEMLDFCTDKQPEKYFIASLLLRAIIDGYAEPKLCRDKRGDFVHKISPEIKADARSWLYSDNESVGTAEWACQALGICRKSLISRIENQIIKPNYRNRMVR